MEDDFLEKIDKTISLIRSSQMYQRLIWKERRERRERIRMDYRNIVIRKR
jgi:hypothetical protein